MTTLPKPPVASGPPPALCAQERVFPGDRPRAPGAFFSPLQRQYLLRRLKRAVRGADAEGMTREESAAYLRFLCEQELGLPLDELFERYCRERIPLLQKELEDANICGDTGRLAPGSE